MDESELRSPVFKRLSRRGLIGLDAGAAILYLLVMLTLPAGGCGSMLMAAVLIPAAGLPLALRRLWPVPVFAVTLAASTAMLVVDLPWDSYAAAAYALYPVALTRRRRRWVPTSLIGVASGLFILGGAMVGPAGRHAEIAGKVLLGLAVLGASWTLGRVVRERRAQAARSARRLADQAVSDERLRIARELHDVVAHSMSLIAVKAGVAVHVAEARPEEALDALRVIEATSRSSLAEMRHLLGVLRTGAADAELTPSPGLADLSGLADRAAMAGVHVDLDVDTGDLPDGVALSAYRIVQEAITNVVKHAAPARCRVRVEADGVRMRIDVTDDGPGVRVLPGGDGHGLIGMRERVMMYGGDFTAGPRPEGGFAVSAAFPYES
ncbi:sensor histidine kinase [Actinomadura madurae]|uniref:sensor histidine kinase n=1 Tax=Actinomadura madurae TaxID=1993 RepID=UPI002025CDF1|nr:sensor histidine kinase [Actinomadura madurae]MCP9972564.1 sensor histidine kinase [Actinomadura madurae]MCP9985071.1 sensor histidine kinase [Actinomadura madurae]URN03406.1 sensor histidine kinase [Actinomadura madurae]